MKHGCGAPSTDGENTMDENLETNYNRHNETYQSEDEVSRKGFLALVFMGFLLNYVEAMVIPSIPALQVTFGSSTSVSSWIISAFLITATVAAPLFGKLGDKYGKKRMLIVTFIIYTTGVGLAGFAPSIGFLIFSRAIQGIGFGGIPLGFAILIDMFPREKLAGAQGVMSGMFATGGVTGLVAGSYIISVAGWQWAFHSALIISIALLGALLIFVRDNGSQVQERIDFFGAVSLTLGLTLILLYITLGSSSGWLMARNLLMVFSGVILIGVFLWYERRTSEPLLQLNVMSGRNIKVANLLGIFAGAAMQIMFLALVYFSNDPVPFGDGFSNTTTGLVLAPGAISMIIYGPLTGRLIRRTGPKPMMAMGGVLLAAGMSIFLLLRTDMIWLIVAGIFTWLGMVSFFVPIVNMISMELPPERRSIGVGMNMMLRNMGGAIGPAVAASLMTVYSISLPGTAVSLPKPEAFNMLMVLGFILVGIMIVLNFATRNYTFRKTGNS